MAANLSDGLRALKVSTKGQPCKRIKLLNGETIEGTIQEVNGDTIIITLTDRGAGAPSYTIPFHSILYVSNSELP